MNSIKKICVITFLLYVVSAYGADAEVENDDSWMRWILHQETILKDSVILLPIQYILNDEVFLISPSFLIEYLKTNVDMNAVKTVLLIGCIEPKQQFIDWYLFNMRFNFASIEVLIYGVTKDQFKNHLVINNFQSIVFACKKEFDKEKTYSLGLVRQLNVYNDNLAHYGIDTRWQILKIVKEYMEQNDNCRPSDCYVKELSNIQ